MWDESIEKLLQRYCDESQVREALHRRAFYWYKKMLTWFQLPIIILSAASGSVQFLSQSYPEYESSIVTGTAATSIMVSIISAVMTYLKLGEFKQRHESAEIAWQSFHNTIKHELSLAIRFRRPANEFLGETKLAYDRLFEMSPILNRRFINMVKKRVRANASDQFQIPCYLNGFKHTQVYKVRDQVDDDFEENTEVEEVQEV